MTQLWHKPLPPRRHYYKRLYGALLHAMTLLLLSLLIGVCGYHFLGGLGYLDSLVNASMILGGMGPVDAIHSTSGKIFASFYALYSGVAFLTIAALMFAPVYHRFLHRFHLEVTDHKEK